MASNQSQVVNSKCTCCWALCDIVMFFGLTDHDVAVMTDSLSSTGGLGCAASSSTVNFFWAKLNSSLEPTQASQSEVPCQEGWSGWLS